MKIHKIFFFISLFINLFITANADLTIVGPVKFDDGIFRLSLIWMQQLQQDIRINFLSTGFVDLKNVDTKIKKIISKSIKKIESIKKNPGNVSVLLSSPWTIWGNHADIMPDSKLKIAYSMLEGTKIPDQWVKIFNDKFDSVVVPDVYLKKVYKNCGVNIPIFVLPCALLLEDFLSQPIKSNANKPFKFGTSATYIPSKNHEILLRAFIKNFKNNSNVELYLHGRGGDDKKLKKIIKNSNTKNVFLINKSFSHEEYLNFIKSLDCYVLLSQGEGFSITPREAMALGIPCILSNNTAQTTICQTGLVEVVKSEILVPAFYAPFDCNLGYKFNCTVEDAIIALKNVFNNYKSYLNKAQEMRSWAKTYNYPNLKTKYLALVKPKKVIYGNHNVIEDNNLITNSLKLYNKYMELKKG